MPPSLYQSMDRCGTLGGEIESVPDTRKCGSLMCGSSSFSPEKKPLTARFYGKEKKIDISSREQLDKILAKYAE